MELVKKEDTKTGTGSNTGTTGTVLSLSEKRQIATGTATAPTTASATGAGVLKTGAEPGATGGTGATGGIGATGIPPTQPSDQDIKNALNDLQSGGVGGIGVGGVPVIGPQQQLPQVDIKVCKAMVRIIYGLPQVLMGFEYEFSDITINDRAEMLMAVLNQYNMTQFKHLNLMFLGVGVSGDMIEMFGAYRKWKKQEDQNSVLKEKEDELKVLQMERQKADELAALNEKLDKANAAAKKLGMEKLSVDKSIEKQISEVNIPGHHAESMEKDNIIQDASTLPSAKLSKNFEG